RLDAQLLHSEDVGTEVQLRRADPVPDAVPGEEGHLPATQRSEDVTSRRITKGGREAHFLTIRQLGHVVQAAASDDADLTVHSGIRVSEVRSQKSEAGTPVAGYRAGSTMILPSLRRR